MTVVAEPAAFRRRRRQRLRRSVDRCDGRGLGDQRRQRSRHRQTGADRGGQRGQDGAARRRRAGSSRSAAAGSGCAARRLGCSARHSMEPSASWRRAMSESCCEPNRQRGVQVGGRDRVGAGAGQRGADGRVERRDHHLRRQPPRRGVGASAAAPRRRSLRRTESAAAIATVLPLALSRSTARPVSGPSGSRVAPRVDGDAQDLVDDVAGARWWRSRSARDRRPVARASRSACAYGSGATHIRCASARSRFNQLDRRGLPGARDASGCPAAARGRRGSRRRRSRRSSR